MKSAFSLIFSNFESEICSSYEIFYAMDKKCDEAVILTILDIIYSVKILCELRNVCCTVFYYDCL